MLPGKKTEMSNPELPGYELLERLPGVGVWNVFKARQLSLNRMVIVKFLPAALLEDEGDSKPFIFETRRVALIKHPNIAQIYDFGRTGGHYFSVIEFVDGFSLAAWINKARFLPSHTALLVTEGVAKALAFAWDKAGVTHGAIKPSNVLVDADGTIKVTDFGLSATMRMIRQKESGMPAGAQPSFLNYTAPEHRGGRAEADCRGDIYALGALLYHMISGQVPPLDAPAGAEPDALAVAPDVPPEAVRLIRKFMAQDRENRPGDWKDTLQDILRVKSGNQPYGNPPPGTEAPAAAPAAAPPKLSTVSVIVKAEPMVTAAPADKAAYARLAAKAAAVFMAALGRQWSRLLQQSRIQAFLIAAAAALIGLLLFYPQIKTFLAAQIMPRTPHARKSVPRTPSQTPAQDGAPPDAHRPDAGEPGRQTGELAPHPGSARENPEAEDNLRLSEILAWARDNPDKPRDAIGKFEELAGRTPPTRASRLAAGEADRLRSQLEQDIVAEIRVQAQALAAQGRFNDAADLCRKYQGPLAGETAEARAKLAESFLEEERTLARNKQREAEQAERQFAGAIAAAVERLLSDEAEEALKLAETAGAMPAAEPRRAELQAFASAISAAGTLEEYVLRSFRNNLNREITLELSGGPEALVITNVAGSALQCEKVTKVGSGEIRQPRNIAFKELALSETARRIPRANPEQDALLAGILCHKAGNLAKAAQYFEKTGPLLAPVLAEYVRTYAARRSERDAEDTLIRIFRAANIALEEGPFSTPEAMAALGRRKLAPLEARLLAQQAAAYRARYGRTEFAQRAEPVLLAMSSAAPAETPAKDAAPAAGAGAKSFDAAIEETPSDIVESFHIRFSDLNPDVTRGQVSIESDDAGAVTGVEIVSPRLKDIAPLAAFSNLTKLAATGAGSANLLGMVVPAPLKDLSPVAGRRIQDLNIGYTRVKDLSPLRGMPIKNLNIQFTLVEDISPLKGMPLETLNMDGTDVRNFEPLSGAPLHRLSLNRTLMFDASPLRNLPLMELSLRRTRITHITGLQGMRLTHLDLSHTKVHNLGPLKGMPLQRLIMDGVPASDLMPLAGSRLATLSAASSDVKDLSALRGMPLTALNLESTGVSDLSPLSGLPLESLNLRNKVRDLAPLRGMPLRTLDIRQTDVKSLSPIRNLPIEELFVDNPEAFKDDLDGMPENMTINPKPGERN